MNSQKHNALTNAGSPYLRAAQDQPVDWVEWSAEAFARAEREDKPILLDIGATWCHWCHVMDHESYTDPALAALINEHFIAIRVDRDERPDVDARYQAAVAAISGEGGYPLTAVLTPDGRPFFGGGYFAHEDRYGRPGLRRVLLSMVDAFRGRRREVEESATSVLHAIEENETFAEPGKPLDQQLLQAMLTAMLKQADRRYGGFGEQPKFLHTGVLEFLLGAAEPDHPVAGEAHEIVELSLQRMAAGGIHDQLAGGFHRYSVDERWIVPRFEKLASDNAQLLQLYAHAFETFGDERYRRVAAKTLLWMDTNLTDQSQGGFFASQNGEALPGDNGDAYTWTRAEAEAVLTEAELLIAEAVYGLRPVGHMQHDPARSVLHQAGDLAAAATRTGLPVSDAISLFQNAHAKLYTARQSRTAPPVDRTVYTGWNGLCISAYLEAGRVLHMPAAVDFALKSLNRVLAAAWQPARDLQHVVSYPNGGTGSSTSAPLEDYVALATACLDAWQTMSDPRFLSLSRELADSVLERFWDYEGAGFFDLPRDAQGTAPGALRTRRKPIQDAPAPSGNGLAALLLLRLSRATGEPLYRQRAEEMLVAFAGVAEHLGLYAATYARALQLFLSRSEPRSSREDTLQRPAGTQASTGSVV